MHHPWLLATSDFAIAYQLNHETKTDVVMIEPRIKKWCLYYKNNNKHFAAVSS